MVGAILIAVASASVGPTSDLTHVATFSTGMSYPGRLAARPGGGIYVTELPTNSVLEYSAPDTLVTHTIAEGPVGIAVHSDGRVFISRADGKIGVYDSSFVEQVAFDGAPTTMDEPNDMVFDPISQDLYVVDSGRDQVMVFKETAPNVWTLARAWGTSGPGLSQFETPQAIALDPGSGHVIVADTDNFRVQVFDRNGFLQYKFGYRMLYIPSGDFAWFARTEGLAVDACGNIYASDALTGTVRVFDALGVELDPDHLPALTYGTGPETVRVPMDVMIAGGQFYVASGNNAAVEVYDVACTLAAVADSNSGSKHKTAAGNERIKRALRRPAVPDNPFDMVRAINGGASFRRFDLNRDRKIDVRDLEIVVDQFGAGTVDDFLTDATVATTTYDPPHVLDITFACGRCHYPEEMLPGGMMTLEGQANLCLSCHSAGGVATHKPISGLDADNSHPIGVEADDGDVMGPDPDSLSEIALHLDDGDIRCGTCHDPMSNDRGEPFLRATIGDAHLCGECHIEGDEWAHSGHSDLYYLRSGGSCGKCHSGQGFIEYTGASAPDALGADPVAHSCVVCHGVHENDNDELLRIAGEVTLPGDHVVDAGTNASCLECHNGRGTRAERSTPHGLIGGVMLEGVNGVEFGATLTNSRHTTVAGCTDCHMAPTPGEGEPGAGKVGGHSFNMAVYDPEDDDFGFENVENSCNVAECHGNTGGLTELNRPAFGDFDGSGTVEGVQDEVQGLLDLVAGELIAGGAVYTTRWYTATCVGGPADGDICRRASDCDAGVCTDMPNADLFKDAIWNLAYVENDGSLGIHNTDYAVGLLQVTYEQLSGEPVPDAPLRYTPAGLTATVVEITEVIGSSPVEPDGPFAVNFTIVDGVGDPIPMGELDRLRLYVSAPSYNYQRVIYSDSDPAHFVQNLDNSYTYSGDPFPTVYLAPLNDSLDLTDGEMTGDPLLAGTYTVLIESRRIFSGIRKAGDATFDFVVTNDPMSPPALAPRQFVLQGNCNACHLDLQLHGRNRHSVTGCVICHTRGAEDEITDPATTSGLTVQFGRMIHKIHSGHDLRNVAATANGADPYSYEIGGHDYSEVGFPYMPAGVTHCDACHGGAAQEADIYANGSITQFNCSSCHDDIDFTTGTILDQDNGSVDDGLLDEADLSDPAYREWPDDGAADHTLPNNSLCADCHGDGEDESVEIEHRHSTDPAAEGTGLAIEIVSVDGMTGGGDSYFVAGDIPEITFRLTDAGNDPLALPITTDSTVVDRIAFIVAGPTTLYQRIIDRQRPWRNGWLSVPAANLLDNGDGTYTFISEVAFPTYYPVQMHTSDVDAEQDFPFAEGWGHQYSEVGRPLDAGTYTIVAWGRRVTSAGDREPAQTVTWDVPFGAADPIVPYAGTVTSAKCNECHGTLAFHGNAREGVRSCMTCHAAGAGTGESTDLRIMVHKLHNARNLTNPYILGGDDLSHLLISSMPGEAAECEVCHANDDWKAPPLRDNMRTWMSACTSCHDSEEAAAHADAMRLPDTFVEFCTICHGEGTAYSVETVHESP